LALLLHLKMIKNMLNQFY